MLTRETYLKWINGKCELCDNGANGHFWGLFELCDDCNDRMTDSYKAYIKEQENSGDGDLPCCAE